jgi:hypothetical protein
MHRWVVLLVLVTGCGRVGFDERPSIEAEGDEHVCTPGAPECRVIGTTDPLEVTCNDNAACHVICQSAASCDVECGGSASCHVICPPDNCTVTGCIGDACVVTCGGLQLATRDGSTASCP